MILPWRNDVWEVDKIRQEAQKLYESTLKPSRVATQVSNFVFSSENLDKWTRRLYLLETQIGGVGVHNVNRLMHSATHTNPWVTGAYHHQDRDIFRPIQYCSAIFLRFFIAADTRYLVDNSCGHVESILKRIHRNLRGGKESEVPMGTVIHRLSTLDDFADANGVEMLRVSRLVNSVYRLAKHEFEYDAAENEAALDMESHLFSYDEAAFTYFGCRLHGLRLMEWMRNRGMEPKSLSSLHSCSWEEFAKVARIESEGLRSENPGLAKEGKRWL